jgi:flavocytochrome c
MEILGKWDEETDVVIVGSGFAGLAAAIEIKKAGSSVMVLEKRKVRGGNSMISGGVLVAAGSPLQKEKGIKDSPELLFSDMLKAGLYLNHPDLVRIVAERSNEALQWTINELGVRYDETLTQWGGHSVPRSYTTHNKSGATIIHRQLVRLKEMGVYVRTRSLFTKFIWHEEDRRVKGVQFREGYRFPIKNSGEMKYIKARKAVILATGGFGSDVPFRSAQDPRLTEETDSTNQPGATAEALVEALHIGAMPVHLSWIQVGPWTCPDEKGFGIGPWFVATVVFIYGVLVDPATGKRFVNEMADRKVRADAILNVGQASIGIADTEAAKVRADFMSRLLKKKIVSRFDTLEDLAAAYHIPYENLRETIDQYNNFVLERKDKEFGKVIPDDAKPIRQPPFHAIRVWPKVHHTMGGVQINSQAQVVGLTHKIIKGLYAAGEVTGGIHGASRLGSCSIADCLIFGRIAGKNAAAEKPWC